MRRLEYSLVVVAVLVTGCAETNPATPSPQPAGPGSITFVRHPQTLLLSGSTVTIDAHVRNDRGELVSGIPVRFSATSGTLHPPVATSVNGIATTTITADHATVVTAATENARADLELPAVAPYSIIVSGVRRLADPLQGWDVAVDVAPNRAVANPPRPQSVTLDCGLGEARPVTTFGFPMRCLFNRTGDFTAVATAVASNGWTLQGSARLSVGPPAAGPTAPITLSFAGEVSRGPGFVEVGFAAGGGPFSVVGWDFGDGASATSSGRESHIYTAGTYTVRANGHPVGGGPPTTATLTIVVDCSSGVCRASQPQV